MQNFLEQLFQPASLKTQPDLIQGVANAADPNQVAAATDALANGQPVPQVAPLAAFGGGTQAGGATGASTGTKLGDVLKNIKAPETKAQFSGGVSGTQLPFKTAISDMITPFLAQLATLQHPQQPTLGALLSQAPGGKR